MLQAFAYALDRTPPATLVELAIWMACPIVLVIWICVLDRPVRPRARRARSAPRQISPREGMAAKPPIPITPQEAAGPRPTMDRAA